jgi:hypothetical protein
MLTLKKGNLLSSILAITLINLVEEDLMDSTRNYLLFFKQPPIKLLEFLLLVVKSFALIYFKQVIQVPLRFI